MSEGGFVQFIQKNTMNFAQGVNFFVDKSLFMRQMIMENRSSYLIIRPRKLGKTFNLQMAKTYFSPDCILIDDVLTPRLGNTKNSIYFKGGSKIGKEGKVKHYDRLLIADDKFYDWSQGHYPVIFLPMGNLSSLSFKRFKQNFEDMIAQAYREHILIAINYLYYDIGHDHAKKIISAAGLSMEEPNDYGKIYDELIKIAKQEVIKLSNTSLRFYSTLHKELLDQQLQTSILFLTKILQSFYEGQQVYVLVDDYDETLLKMIKEFLLIRPKERKQMMEDITKVAQLITSVLASIAESKTLEKLVMTGRSALLNNYGKLKIQAIHTMGDDGIFKQNFGFSQKNVRQLLKRVQKYRSYFYDSHIREAKGMKSIALQYLWTLKDQQFYDPWSIINHLEQFVRTPYGGAPIALNYWDQGWSSFIHEHIDHLNVHTYIKLGYLVTKCIAFQGKGISEINLAYLSPLLRNEFVFDEKVVIFILQADGYIIPIETPTSQKGYSKSHKLAGEIYKEDFAKEWLDFQFRGRIQKKIEKKIYLSRQKEEEEPCNAQQGSLIFGSEKRAPKCMAPSLSQQKTWRFRNEMRKAQIQKYFESRRLQFGRFEDEENESGDQFVILHPQQ